MPKVVDHAVRRAEVLEATWRVIVRAGLEGTTIREIAREANCSTGVLAHYFKDKDEILRLALDYAHEQVRGRVAALRERMGGVQLLRAVLAEALPVDGLRHVEMTLEISFWARAVAQTALRPSQNADFDRWHGRLRELIQLAIDAEELPAALDADEAATIMVCFTDGLGTDAVLYPGRFSPTRVDALLDHQLVMLGADPARLHGAATSTP
ncbi:MAG: transcriptional regulator [Ilumatobacteraceae bacterium]|nr:transcriptional regulator [Ilumatobacteraceae bacterium]